MLDSQAKDTLSRGQVGGKPECHGHRHEKKKMTTAFLFTFFLLLSTLSENVWESTKALRNSGFYCKAARGHF